VQPEEVIAVKGVIQRCELCSSDAVTGARLCVACAEAVKRLAEAQNAVIQQDDASPNEPEALKRKSERARAQAEKLTPVILG